MARGATTAITREVSASIGACELTHLARTPIDLARARAQHDAYERALERAGCVIVRAEPAPDLPDAVFVEDTAVVFDEVGIVLRPGAVSRRPEVPAVAAVLSRFRTLHDIRAPGTIDGGDVVVAGRRVLIGRSSRTNDEGIAQLRRIVEPLGYRVTVVEVRGCLHLKSAATPIDDHRLLVNPEWITTDDVRGFDVLAVDPAEPYAANILRVGDDAYVYSAAFPRTCDRLARAGLAMSMVDVSELAKAEAAVTCCSLLLRQI